MTCHHCLSSLLLACSLPLAACAVEGPATPDAAQEQSLLSDLQSGVALHMDPANSSLSLEARWNRGSEWTEGAADLSLTAGTLLMSADAEGALQIDSLSLSLADVIIENELFSSSIHLTDVSVEQEGPRECHASDWSPDDQSCSALLTTRLTLDWSLRIDDEMVVPLGAQTLDDLTIEVQVDAAETGVEASLYVSDGGSLWTWANVIELNGLELEIVADELGPVD